MLKQRSDFQDNYNETMQEKKNRFRRSDLYYDNIRARAIL